ncbi:MAG: hypothetical protein LBH03_04515 [Holophagales bacterium]|jgi:hypothetical protein|nr:hypothetical protein [Holophagales bacterium]
MKKSTKGLACIAPAVLILAMGCKSKPVEVAPVVEAPVSRNAFIGNWVGTDKNGVTCTLKFTNDFRWESHIEEGGTIRPHYKGTYEMEGSRIRLKVTEEVNFNTFEWRAARGGTPTNISCTLSNGTLKTAGVLTDAELKRR